MVRFWCLGFCGFRSFFFGFESIIEAGFRVSGLGMGCGSWVSVSGFADEEYYIRLIVRNN